MLRLVFIVFAVFLSGCNTLPSNLELGKPLHNGEMVVFYTTTFQDANSGEILDEHPGQDWVILGKHIKKTFGLQTFPKPAPIAQRHVNLENGVLKIYKSLAEDQQLFVSTYKGAYHFREGLKNQLTFKAYPNKAVYIGTIAYKKVGYRKLNVEVIDDFEQAKKIFEKDQPEFKDEIVKSILKRGYENGIHDQSVISKGGLF